MPLFIPAHDSITCYQCTRFWSITQCSQSVVAPVPNSLFKMYYWH